VGGACNCFVLLSKLREWSHKRKQWRESKERMHGDGGTHRESVHNTERLQQSGKETAYIAAQK